MSKASGDLDSYDGSGDWFKIQQIGPTFKSSCSASWDMSKAYKVTIPKSVPSGNYLVRVESIALHLAQNVGGAQLYISCAQISLTGGGDGVPGPLVAFPGAYKANDPGLIWPNSPPRTSYTAPGPAVWVG